MNPPPNQNHSNQGEIIMKIETFLAMYKENPTETKKLTTLDLRSNNITKLPIELFKLTKLKYLNLSNNKLNYLPREIGKLIELEQLILSYNSIIELPFEIGNLKNLKELHLLTVV